MKRIIIVSHAMEIGGAERALLGLLNSFDYSNYQVALRIRKTKSKVFCKKTCKRVGTQKRQSS